MIIFDIFDETQRPRAPGIPGANGHHRLSGRKLAMIHNMHLAALDETNEMMLRVESREAAASDLSRQISSLELLSNYRTFGTLCGRECQFLDFHHTSEDAEIFPIIATGGSAGLKQVIARLLDEHKFIAELLEKLASNATELFVNPSPKAFSETKTTFELLYKVVRSHFGYEQGELEEAIGFYGVPF